MGAKLLRLSDRAFAAWHLVRDGLSGAADAAAWIARRLHGPFRAALAAGVACGASRAAGLCADLLARRESLWRFGATPGVEPTNNAAERALRPAVLWRKTSQGTRSAAGSAFVAALLTVTATCRQQARSVWDYLTSAFAAPGPQAVPSLLLTP